MTHADTSTLAEASGVGAAAGVTDALQWHCDWRLEKFEVPDDLSALPGEEQVRLLREAGVEPFEVLEQVGNLLTYGGISCLWQGLIGNITGTAGQALTRFDNANAAIGVGDSTTAAAATQTDLQAATNKVRQAMDATYPQHTDATTAGAASIVFRATFGTGAATWAWQEWGVFNSPTAATGRMLNRKVESLGTKTSSASWQLTVTLSLS
jgi:hypothetical protein